MDKQGSGMGYSNSTFGGVSPFSAVAVSQAQSVLSSYQKMQAQKMLQSKREFMLRPKFGAGGVLKDLNVAPISRLNVPLELKIRGKVLKELHQAEKNENVTLCHFGKAFAMLNSHIIRVKEVVELNIWSGASSSEADMAGFRDTDFSLSISGISKPGSDGTEAAKASVTGVRYDAPIGLRIDGIADVFKAQGATDEEAAQMDVFACPKFLRPWISKSGPLPFDFIRCSEIVLTEIKVNVVDGSSFETKGDLEVSPKILALPRLTYLKEVEGCTVSSELIPRFDEFALSATSSGHGVIDVTSSSSSGEASAMDVNSASLSGTGVDDAGALTTAGVSGARKRKSSTPSHISQLEPKKRARGVGKAGQKKKDVSEMLTTTTFSISEDVSMSSVEEVTPASPEATTNAG